MKITLEEFYTNYPHKVEFAKYYGAEDLHDCHNWWQYFITKYSADIALSNERAINEFNFSFHPIDNRDNYIYFKLESDYLLFLLKWITNE